MTNAAEGATSPARAGRVIGGAGIASVGVASLVAAASGYLVLIVVARRLSPAANADFLVYWSLLFGAFAVLGGLQQEATRSVGAAGLSAETGDRRGARVLPWSLLIGAGFALLAALTAPWWQPALLAGQPPAVVAVLCVAAVAFTGHMTLVGILAGQRRWSTSALLTGGESALRLVVVGVAAFLGASLAGFEVAVAVSTVFWLAVLVVSRPARAALPARSVDAPRRMTSRALQAMLAALGSGALVVGFPSLLRLSSDSAQWASAAPLVLAISLTRAPLLMPLNAYQGVAISYFLDPRRKRAAALVRVVGAIVGVGIVGAALAAVVGPWLMAAFFGPTYRVSGLLLGALTLAAVALAVLTMTGAAVLALGRHRAYAAGWLVATAVSLAVLFTGLPLAQRAVVSLVAGPVVGVALHAWAVLTSGSAISIPGRRA
ncbi:MAG TPA: hypothetical protein VGK17_19290 [Propionicimonas sp.]